MKKLIILGILCSIAAYARPVRPGCGLDSSVTGDEQELLFDHKQTDNAVAAKWLRSLLPGLLIGGTTGTLSSLFVDDEQPWIATFLVWLLESGLRNSLIKIVADDYKAGQLSYHTNVLHNTGFIASWLSYLIMRHQVPFCPQANVNCALGN